VILCGLMSYGADRVAAHRQAAYYVDRILRGTDPADLPLQAPTKYETALMVGPAATPRGVAMAADAAAPVTKLRRERPICGFIGDVS
jgi:putative ABC transport system substrate-binding protein